MKERTWQLLGVRSQSRAVELVMLVFFVAGLNGCSQSADHQSKIVGTWEVSVLGVSTQQIYSKDGTFRIILPTGQSGVGKWAIQDDQLTLTMSEGGQTKARVAKIITLNDSVLIYEGTDEAGKTMASTWKRLK
jgi:hypothetical protein